LVAVFLHRQTADTSTEAGDLNITAHRPEKRTVKGTLLSNVVSTDARYR
jgi:hypothetical protein